ncbi:hypothetical protein EDB81DRAFT_64512 [Dactylonectria macrodidyma]|uniref:Uncharacterized protein n=1 Tax=Dactylonectria macrodidyma TaxID=307937 RepID=A0A9P9J0H3_9HYPO|nr:hypothetical protein EDB81DRAFT_64512 [Dactylonectria macrodidyma]
MSRVPIDSSRRQSNSKQRWLLTLVCNTTLVLWYLQAMQPPPGRPAVLMHHTATEATPTSSSPSRSLTMSASHFTIHPSMMLYACLRFPALK